MINDSPKDIGTFKKLKVICFQLDEIMQDPEQLEKGDVVVIHETKSLRDTQAILKSASIEDAVQFVKEKPHPKLWKLVAEKALECLNFPVAHKAFVQSGNFQGVQFVKRVQQLQDRSKESAEVAAYFKRFEDAEKTYLSMDRKDLAIELKQRIGDWSGVLQLLRDGDDAVSAAAEDDVKQVALDKLGDQFAEKRQWARALKFYQKSQNYSKTVDCLFALGDFEGIEEMIASLPEANPLLLVRCGSIRVGVGMREYACVRDSVVRCMSVYDICECM